LVRNEVPDISAEALAYLEEAVAAFYADCQLASCVMLGVAAEAEFLRLVDIAVKHTTHGSRFASAANQRFIRQKIKKFHDGLRPLLNVLPQDAVEDLETNLLMIQSVLRIARNDAGHPTIVKVQREQVYVYLQLFVPFARQIMRLRIALQ
jgi:D-serine dehydratase